MPIATSLPPIFAAQIDGIDINYPTDAAWIRDALDRRSVLVFPRQAERRHMVRTTASCPPLVH